MATLLISCGGSKKMVNTEPVATNNFAFDFVESRDLRPVLELAARQGKLVFIDVYTTWCIPCKMMDENVFSNEETASIINPNFISYRVDAEKINGLSVSFMYDVIEYPTLLFLDTEGTVLERNAGSMYHTSLIAMADSAIAKAELAKADKI